MAMPSEKPKGLDSPVTAKLIKYGARLNVAAFRATNGRLGAKWRIGAGWKKPVPVLLLDHVGRKSGQRFTTPLLFLDDGDQYVVVASQGGLPRHPQWYHNLRANPETEIHLPRRGRHPVRARVTEPAERAALWPRLVELYADFDNYAAWTDREIPVVVLESRA
ncbi:nitroreductase family deazaflavin-dependent oxidoreductase [Nocardioides panacisoli]|uniref:nitroreductase family deazaflavin-dependent oxidoreductase n=1 Tax=Nocardioides panacisoli TaxID=627624 RepID=UPI001C62EFA8|nr:nitroreductase family deazaflavin-dependent oxidoreductase [Nocardioides panacisoli]QYJ02932.1 nitroreductase family deazaflavin-dependent oxidoreductase [Nocardioides panacisoli]